MANLKIACGELLGSEENGVHSFKGVAYAEPLIGAARWLAPTPRRPWKGVYDARDYGPACMQFGSGGMRWPFPRARQKYFEAIGGGHPQREDDDCLRLNVWSPTLDQNAKLPVMVWFHGGGFTRGGANDTYDATPFAKKNVVCVVIQYRLGPLGFLHGSGLFEDDLCSDNRAFQDQLCALRWVQENIASFGGDPSRVTLFGQSAGAFSIYQLSASPQSRGLFQRCIALGGMAGTCAPASEYHKLTRDALQDVGVKTGDSSALIALDKTQLFKLQAAISKRVLGKGDINRYGLLSRERIAFLGAATQTDFLPRAPIENYREGTPNSIDLMLGTCENDGNLFSQSFPLGRALSARISSKILSGLMPGADPKSVRDLYLQGMPGKSQTQAIEQINNDAFYRMPTIKAAEAHAQGHPGRTWLFQLNYPSPIPGLGSIHAIDVALLFRSKPILNLLAKDAATEELSDKFRDAMISFASSGTPIVRDVQKWAPYRRDTRFTMIFDRHCDLQSDVGGQFRPSWE